MKTKRSLITLLALAALMLALVLVAGCGKKQPPIETEPVAPPPPAKVDTPPAPTPEPPEPPPPEFPPPTDRGGESSIPTRDWHATTKHIAATPHTTTGRTVGMGS